jgi:hypothetical protein
LRQKASRQDCVHQFVLRQTLAVGGGLQILVGHAQIAVAQIVADGELVFAHLGQHASDRVSKSMPANSVDAKLGECGLDLAVEYSREIQRLPSLCEKRRKHEIRILLIAAPKVWTLIDNSGEVPKVIALERDEMIRIIDRSTYTALVKRYGRK